MPRKHTEEEKTASRQRIATCLKAHPEYKFEDLRADGLENDLCIGFDDRINEARQYAGLPKRFERIKKSERKQMLLSFVKDKPDASPTDLRKNGMGWSFNELYNGNINRLRKDAGVADICALLKRRKDNERRSIRKRQIEERVDRYLAEYPRASRDDLIKAGLYHDMRIAYGGVRNARRKLGINMKSIYLDLWDNGLNINQSREAIEATEAVLKRILTPKELDIAKMYYGLWYSEHTYEEIGRAHNMTEVQVYLSMRRVRKKVGQYCQHALAAALLPYAADNTTSDFLRSIRTE